MARIGLISAVERNNVAEVQRLLCDPKCNVDAFVGKFNPLQVACSSGFLDIVKLLILHGANPRKKDIFPNSGHTPFLLAARNSHSHVLEYLLGINPDLVYDTCHQNQTALHYACQNGDVASIELLLKYNPKLDALDNSKVSPLNLCLLYQKTNCLQISKKLVDAGCDLSIGDPDHSYLFYACFSPNSNLELFQFFLKLLPHKLTYIKPNRESLLHVASHPDVIAYLLTTELSSRINDFVLTGYTPLHLAVIRENLDAVKILLIHNAKLNPKPDQEVLKSSNFFNTTILGHAARCKTPEIFKLILSHNPLPNVSETTDETIFHRLAKEGPLEYFEMLFDHFPESEFKKSYNDQTVLYAAINARNFDIAVFIVKKIPDLANIKSGLADLLPIQVMVKFFPDDLWYLLTVHTLRKDRVWERLTAQYAATNSQEYFNCVKYLLYHHIADCSGDIGLYRVVRNRILWCWVLKETNSLGGLWLKDLEMVIRDYF
ncbi:Ankyrin repeat domain-containing protein 16 [Nowakowskiella sp. JEL0407]|nr:Ankyrin repeat domain-containing protein 16 [Nowakowskiella sp. JEL0407]